MVAAFSSAGNRLASLAGTRVAGGPDGPGLTVSRLGSDAFRGGLDTLEPLFLVLLCAGQGPQAVGEGRREAEGFPRICFGSGGIVQFSPDLGADGKGGGIARVEGDGILREGACLSGAAELDKAAGFIEDNWEGDDRRLIMYIRPLGKGAVLYNTLGHCRGHYDFRPMMDYYPAVERCSWEKPEYYELLRRNLRWCLHEL